MWPTNLSRAALLDACLSEADLTEANLIGADLRGADLSGANMARTIINGANMEGAKFKGVISFNGVIEDVAKQTIPKGVAKQKKGGLTSRRPHWATCPISIKLFEN